MSKRPLKIPREKLAPFGSHQQADKEHVGFPQLDKCHSGIRSNLLVLILKQLGNWHVLAFRRVAANHNGPSKARWVGRAGRGRWGGGKSPSERKCASTSVTALTTFMAVCFAFKTEGFEREASLDWSLYKYFIHPLFLLCTWWWIIYPECEKVKWTFLYCCWSAIIIYFFS